MENGWESVNPNVAGLRISNQRSILPRSPSCGLCHLEMESFDQYLTGIVYCAVSCYRVVLILLVIAV